MNWKERALDAIASAIAAAVVTFCVGGFVFVAFGFRVMRHSNRQITLLEFICVCLAVGLIYGFLTIRKGPGLK